MKHATRDLIWSVAVPTVSALVPWLVVAQAPTQQPDGQLIPRYQVLQGAAPFLGVVVALTYGRSSRRLRRAWSMLPFGVAACYLLLFVVLSFILDAPPEGADWVDRLFWGYLASFLLAPIFALGGGLVAVIDIHTCHRNPGAGTSRRP